MIPSSSSSSWCSKHTMSSSNCFLLSNTPFKIDKELLAGKSAKIHTLIKNDPFVDLTTFFKETPSEPKALELVARFCHGFEVKFTSEIIIPLICLCDHLEMTETHCPGNLLEKSIKFLKHNILPSWDLIIHSLKASWGPILQQAAENGLLNFFVGALTDLALSNPTLLAQPIMIEYAKYNIIRSMNTNYYTTTTTNNNNGTRRKLFADQHSSTSSDSDTSMEDLTSLPVKLYETIMEEMTQQRVPLENIAGSLYRYMKKHGDDREAIEAIERLLPANGSRCPLYPYTILFEMHGLAVAVGAKSECVASLEIRIGKELYRATSENLLALDLDIKGLRRILKGYYGNFTDASSIGLVVVADLMEEYLMGVAKGKELEAASFAEVAEMVSSTSSLGSYRMLDGVYKAVDAYLEKHKELVESEREEVCKVLDFQKMSWEVVEKAALSKRLSLRVVMQALFVSQLQLRDNITKAVGGYSGKSNVMVDDDDGGGGDGDGDGDDDDDEKEEIKGVCHEKNCCARKKKKMSLWKGMKRKFGCIGSSSDYETLNECNCHVTNKNNKKKKKSN